MDRYNQNHGIVIVENKNVELSKLCKQKREQWHLRAIVTSLLNYFWLSPGSGYKAREAESPRIWSKNAKRLNVSST